MFTHSFTAVTPPARYDGVPWTTVRVEESTVATGPFTLVATQAVPVDTTPDTPNPLNVTVTTATLSSGYFRFQFGDAAGNVAAFSPPILSPSTATGVLDVAVLKAQYLNIASTKNDAFLTRILDSTYQFCLTYTGRSAAATPIPSDLQDAIYVHAARNFRERDAMYADQVVLTEDGGVVNYFRSLPPRVKATYDLHSTQNKFLA